MKFGYRKGGGKMVSLCMEEKEQVNGSGFEVDLSEKEVKMEG